MCSIIGVEEHVVPTDKFTEGFYKTKSRGPDMTRVENTSAGRMGFHRLAIMDVNESGMQPFELEGNLLVCNGEIYGFRDLKKELEGEYEFKSSSDCEILLPLYDKYGCEMFKLLDAEFAIIIFDKKKNSFVAARDPIGIRPLYYGKGSNGETMFASEPKNLVGLCGEIMPFPPGHYWTDGELICYCDIAERTQKTSDDLETVCTKIREKLALGVAKRLDSDVPVGFLLSGGLDSSIVCAVATRLLNHPIRTFAIGMSEDAIDLKYARQTSDFIGSEHTEVIIHKADVLNSLDEVVSVLGTYDITTIRASVGMYLICKAIHEQTDVRVLLTGEISDEIFGYKYTDFAPNPEEFQLEAEKRLRELHMYDVLRADRCISTNSLEARVPFGDLDFVQYVMSIPAHMKMNSYKMGKYLLRHAFDGDFLPENILWREKAAFSDAVGHSLVDYIKEYAESIYSDSEFEQKCRKYSFAVPFTKESLLYRELFERHYPRCACMIRGFWMPNPSWPGCDVDDPSARVLKNYGSSGQ